MADDGATCLLAHPAPAGDAAHHNPACPVQHDGPVGRDDGPATPRCRRLPRRAVRHADDGIAFSEREGRALGALADLAAFAVGTARLREAEQQYTIVAERYRIARELHDSLAQCSVVIHLRLAEPGARGA